MKEAESELQAAAAGITDQTPLTQAAESFNSAAFALEMSWLSLFSDAGCLTDEQSKEAVAAVKDWFNDIVSYEKNLRAIRATGRPVAMMSSFTMSLMASFLLGADGCISGMGSVVADLQASLLAAVQAGRFEDASRINDRMAPLVSVFYAPPFVDMHNRMKEALAILGRIPAAHVRPPLTPVSEDERHRIRLALRAASLSS